MDNTVTVKILGNDYPKERIKYSYTGKTIRFKKPLVYLIIAILFLQIRSIYLSLQIADWDNVTSQFIASTMAQTRNIQFIQEIMIVAFIILLIPRINCVFLKIDGIKKDVVLYKSIHKDEVTLIADEINRKIKENNLSSFP